MRYIVTDRNNKDRENAIVDSFNNLLEAERFVEENRNDELTPQSLEIEIEEEGILALETYELLRIAGDRLEEEEGEVLFPGWDSEIELGEEHARECMIKEALAAIEARGLEPDEGTKVSRKSLGALVRYIGDMMGD